MTTGLTYELVKNASNGDAVAIDRVLDIYEPYINVLAAITIKDSGGGQYIGIDVDLKNTLRAKLVDVVFKFNMPDF